MLNYSCAPYLNEIGESFLSPLAACTPMEVVAMSLNKMDGNLMRAEMLALELSLTLVVILFALFSC